MPALPVIFRFDEQLIEDTVGKLQPNTITVDNLTVDWLRQKLNDLENVVKECKENQAKAESNGILPSPATTPTNSTPPASNLHTSSLNLSGSLNNSMNGSSNNLKDLSNK